MSNVKNVEKKAMELDFSLEKANRELKRVASIKCRLLKQKGRPDYESALEAVLKEEQLLKEAKRLIVGTDGKKHVTSFEQADVDKLTYDETVKALNSIWSKKATTRWLTTTEGDNDEFRNAVRIEKMLKEHRDNVQPIDANVIRKSEIQNVIDLIESSGQMTMDTVLEMLKELI